MKAKKYVAFLLIVTMVLGNCFSNLSIFANDGLIPLPTGSPMPTYIPVPTDPPMPDRDPTPTPTYIIPLPDRDPTQTPTYIIPLPDRDPTSTPIYIPVPTITPTKPPMPTYIPVPTATITKPPMPTHIPAPTITPTKPPMPTYVPVPTAAITKPPMPTISTKPSATPLPSAKPTPKPKPALINEPTVGIGADFVSISWTLNQSQYHNTVFIRKTSQATTDKPYDTTGNYSNQYYKKITGLEPDTEYIFSILGEGGEPKLYTKTFRTQKAGSIKLIGEPVIDIGSDYIDVSWTLNQSQRNNTVFVRNTTHEITNKPYDTTGNSKNEYTRRITGLESGTDYVFSILGDGGEPKLYTGYFTTLPEVKLIGEPQLEVGNDYVSVSWTINQAQHHNTVFVRKATQATTDKGYDITGNFKNFYTTKIAELEPNTEYVLSILGQGGEPKLYTGRFTTLQVDDDKFLSSSYIKYSKNDGILNVSFNTKNIIPQKYAMYFQQVQQDLYKLYSIDINNSNQYNLSYSFEDLNLIPNQHLKFKICIYDIYTNRLVEESILTEIHINYDDFQNYIIDSTVKYWKDGYLFNVVFSTNIELSQNYQVYLQKCDSNSRVLRSYAMQNKNKNIYYASYTNDEIELDKENYFKIAIFYNENKLDESLTQFFSLEDFKSLITQGDFDLAPEVQELITYYDDMYMQLSLLYDEGYISKNYYDVNAQMCKNEIDFLRIEGNYEKAKTKKNAVFVVEFIGGLIIPDIIDFLNLMTVEAQAATLDMATMTRVHQDPSIISALMQGNKKYNKNYTIYELIDDDGIVKYVGRTSQDLKAREYQHISADFDTNGNVNPKKYLKIRVAEVNGEKLTNLTYQEARGLEQIVYERYKNLLNKIKPVSPKKDSFYRNIATEFLDKLKKIVK